MKKAEIIIIAALLAACLIWIAAAKHNSVNGRTAHISINGKEAYLLDLENEQHMRIQGENDITLEIECGGGRIRVTSSECPDKICVKKGYISMTDENIVCMPAKVIITVDKGE